MQSWKHYALHWASLANCGAKFCDWTWHQLLSLNTEPASLVRDTCTHMPGFPNALLLLLPAQEGGQGVKRQSFRILEAKLSIFHGLFHRKDTSGLALHSMITQLARQLRMHTATRHTTILPAWDGIPASIRKKHFFLCILLEVGALASPQLTVDGNLLPTLSANTCLGSITTNSSIFKSHCHHLHDLLTLGSSQASLP